MEEKSGRGYTEPLWENYRRARKEVKKAIMKGKKELRKRTVRKIREQGGTTCSCNVLD